MPFVLRTIGGPLDGQTRVVDVTVMPWPWPDELPIPIGVYRDPQTPKPKFQTGRYVKIHESQLPPEAAAHPNVGVGAEYEWREYE
jgi:hypothetical protein